jgi:hypothetical protein
MVAQPRLLARSLSIDQAFGDALVATHDPITNDLERDIVETGGVASNTSRSPQRFRFTAFWKAKIVDLTATPYSPS